MRHIIKIAALALLPLVLGGYAQAAENEGKVITLSCDGTLTRTYYGANKPADREPFQTTTVVVNLDEQTMFFLGYILPIYDVDEASINFGARQIAVDYGFSVAITGIFDRLPQKFRQLGGSLARSGRLATHVIVKRGNVRIVGVRQVLSIGKQTRNPTVQQEVSSDSAENPLAKSRATVRAGDD
jgi:hypothetical protein